VDIKINLLKTTVFKVDHFVTDEIISLIFSYGEVQEFRIFSYKNVLTKKCKLINTP